MAEGDLEAIFHEELKAYFTAPERIAGHIAKAREGMAEREARLSAHQTEIQKVRDQMARTHQLYLDGQIPLASFGGFHKPLEERLRQLQDEQPRLEAELAHLKVTDLSAEEVLGEARKLYSRWSTLPLADRRSVVQSIVEKITVGKDEIEISLSYLPSSEELTKSQQRLLELLGIRERILRVRRADKRRLGKRVRTPFPESPRTLGQHIHRKRLEAGLTQGQLGAQLGVWRSAVGSWEADHYEPQPPVRARVLAFAGLGPDWQLAQRSNG
jgi:chromosome segregation ATPase